MEDQPLCSPVVLKIKRSDTLHFFTACIKISLIFPVFSSVRQSSPSLPVVDESQMLCWPSHRRPCHARVSLSGVCTMVVRPPLAQVLPS